MPRVEPVYKPLVEALQLELIPQCSVKSGSHFGTFSRHQPLLRLCGSVLVAVVMIS